MHYVVKTEGQQALVRSRFFFALLLLLAGSPLQAGPASWVQLQSQVAEHWSLVPDKANPNRIELISRRPPHRHARRVLVLFTKDAAAYDTSLSTMLTIFDVKRMPAVFSLVLLNSEEQARLPGMPLPFDPARFHLILAMGSDATIYAYKHLNDLATPIVSVCAKDPALLLGLSPEDFARKKPTNMAFTSLDIPAKAHFFFLTKLVGEPRVIALLYDQEDTSTIRAQINPLKEHAAREGAQVLEVMVDPAHAREELERKLPTVLAQMRRKGTGAKGHVFWVAGSSKVFKEIETIAQLAEDIPVVSMAENAVAEGDASAVMFIGVGFQSNAHLAALRATDILRGDVKPSELEVGVVSPPDIAINFRKARQLGLQIPFELLEAANYVYDYNGRLVFKQGRQLSSGRDADGGGAPR